MVNQVERSPGSLPLTDEELQDKIAVIRTMKDYELVPDWLLLDIMEHGWQFKPTMCSDFTYAVITNHFVGAMTRADIEMRKALHGIALLLHNRIPAGSWGSVKTVKEWLTTKKEQYLEATCR